MNELQIWHGPNGISLPATIKTPQEIIPFATTLTPKQQSQILNAFQIHAYDMAAEYAWKKAMVKLKETLSTLGMDFIGEMLNRADIDDFTSIDVALSDFSAIKLAEQLGVIGKTAALKLRQSNELIVHYFSRDAEEELDYPTAFGIVKSSVQYILGEQNISIALEFSQFRNRLLSETLKSDDVQVEQVIGSPVFYLRTILTILLSSIRTDIGAKLEHALANLNLLLPRIWNNIGENDKWNVGSAYRDVTASGNSFAISGMKTALLKVGGFDFVPENLRSTTFIKAAKQLLETHFAMNNFYNEPGAIRKLADLGTTIPAPALINCMQAYLAVYLGNKYGVSNAAWGTAQSQLSNISKDRWEYYFEKVVQTDDVVLDKFRTGDQVERFSQLLHDNDLTDFENMPKDNRALYNAILANDATRAYRVAERMLDELR